MERDDAFSYFRDLVYRLSGTSLGPDKAYLMETRLGALATNLGFQTVGALIAKLRAGDGSDLHARAVEVMTNGETSFFRDPECFDALRTRVLPELVAHRRESRRLTVWSAACATGQEPYSVALLLAEWFPELDDWDVQIVASDLSRDRLIRAERGCYSQFEVNRGLPAKLLVKYFEQEGDEWVLSPRIQRRVDFRPFNLMGGYTPAIGFDLVLLRNVMIYWDLDTRRRVLTAVRQALRPNGRLVLGAAETTHLVDDRFERYLEGGPCCYCLSRQLPVAALGG